MPDYGIPYFMAYRTALVLFLVVGAAGPASAQQARTFDVRPVSIKAKDVARDVGPHPFPDENEVRAFMGLVASRHRSYDQPAPVVEKVELPVPLRVSGAPRELELTDGLYWGVQVTYRYITLRERSHVWVRKTTVFLFRNGEWSDLELPCETRPGTPRPPYCLY